MDEQKAGDCQTDRHEFVAGRSRSQFGRLKPEWEEREENFAVCGGCVPVRMKDGRRPFAYVLVSNMEHQEDHQVIADAMAGQLQVEIPRIVINKKNAL